MEEPFRQISNQKSSIINQRDFLIMCNLLGGLHKIRVVFWNSRVARILPLWQSVARQVKIRAVIQALLLVAWALLPALQAGMVDTPGCKAAAGCACCEEGACDCANTPESAPESDSQPLVPLDSGKQVFTPALQANGLAEVALVSAAAKPWSPSAASRVAWPAPPVPPRLLYCRFLI